MELTIEQKKQCLLQTRAKIKRLMKDVTDDELFKFSSVLAAKPLEVLEAQPELLTLYQLSIGIILGELLIEREENQS